MTNRVTLPPQDFQKMCKQAERDHEARKLVVLMERVKKQIANRDGLAGGQNRPVAVIHGVDFSRMPSRSAPFER